MFENELTPVDFSTAELGAAWLEELNRVRTQAAKTSAQLTAVRGMSYVSAEVEAAGGEMAISRKLLQLQSDETALGQVLEVARRARATVGVGQ